MFGGVAVYQVDVFVEVDLTALAEEESLLSEDGHLNLRSVAGISAGTTSTCDPRSRSRNKRGACSP
jgi:hypothetical protein